MMKTTRTKMYRWQTTTTTKTIYRRQGLGEAQQEILGGGEGEGGHCLKNQRQDVIREHRHRGKARESSIYFSG